jgi:hypothetical protein
MRKCFWDISFLCSARILTNCIKLSTISFVKKIKHVIRNNFFRERYVEIINVIGFGIQSFTQTHLYYREYPSNVTLFFQWCTHYMYIYMSYISDLSYFCDEHENMRSLDRRWKLTHFQLGATVQVCIYIFWNMFGWHFSDSLEWALLPINSSSHSSIKFRKKIIRLKLAFFSQSLLIWV